MGYPVGGGGGAADAVRVWCGGKGVDCLQFQCVLHYCWISWCQVGLEVTFPGPAGEASRGVYAMGVECRKCDHSKLQLLGRVDNFVVPLPASLFNVALETLHRSPAAL